MIHFGRDGGQGRTRDDDDEEEEEEEEEEDDDDEERKYGLAGGPCGYFMLDGAASSGGGGGARPIGPGGKALCGGRCCGCLASGFVPVVAVAAVFAAFCLSTAAQKSRHHVVSASR